LRVRRRAGFVAMQVEGITLKVTCASEKEEEEG